MNIRLMLSGTCTLLCVAAFTGATIQGRHLGGLRAERQRLVVQAASPTHAASPAPTQSSPVRQRDAPRPSVELLQLRGQISQLLARKRELAGGEAENAQLRQQLATRGAIGAQLPPGYLRKAEAKSVGYKTPEDTLQTFLWSIQQRDFQSVVQALTPEAVEDIRRQVERAGSEEEFFNQMAAFIGFRILERQQREDGSVNLKVEIAPRQDFTGQDLNEDIRLRLMNGQWKMEF